MKDNEKYYADKAEDYYNTCLSFEKYIGELPVIILVGGKSNAGKGTLAKHLENKLREKSYHVIRCSLSTYIRKITRDFYWDGKDTPQSRKFMAEVYRLATELIYPYHMMKRVWENDIKPYLHLTDIYICLLYTSPSPRDTR